MIEWIQFSLWEQILCLRPWNASNANIFFLLYSYDEGKYIYIIRFGIVSHHKKAIPCICMMANNVLLLYLLSPPLSWMSLYQFNGSGNVYADWTTKCHCICTGSFICFFGFCFHFRSRSRSRSESTIHSPKCQRFEEWKAWKRKLLYFDAFARKNTLIFVIKVE